VRTGNFTPSERRRLGYEDMVLLEARRNKRFESNVIGPAVRMREMILRMMRRTS
jgi:hypothetical protein